MTATQKVKLVASVVGEYSLSSALTAVELSTSTLRLRSVQALVLSSAAESRLRREVRASAASARRDRAPAFRIRLSSHNDRATRDLPRACQPQGCATATPALGVDSAENDSSTEAEWHPPSHRRCG